MKRRILIDALAAVAGMAAAWIVADLIVAADERRRPLISQPHKLKHYFRDSDRMAGVFHLSTSIQDTMHLGYHADKTMTTEKRTYHGTQALFSVVRLIYHVGWAYVRHVAADRRRHEV